MELKIEPESLRVQKTRMQLDEQWKKWDECVTQKALEETSAKIQKWLDDHDRVHLPKKNWFGYFAEGKEAVEQSGKIQKLYDSIKSL